MLKRVPVKILLEHKLLPQIQKSSGYQTRLNMMHYLNNQMNPARNTYSNRQMVNSQRLLMSQMMMSRRRRPTTPAPMMGQLNAAERNAMMMNQMLPFLLMQQQQPASQGNNQAVGVDPSAPGAQAAPGENAHNAYAHGAFSHSA